MWRDLSKKYPHQNNNKSQKYVISGFGVLALMAENIDKLYYDKSDSKPTLGKLRG